MKRVRESRSGGNCALLRLDSGFIKNVCFDDTLKRLNYRCINSDLNYKPLYTATFATNLVGFSNACKNDPYAYQACGFTKTRVTNTEVLCGGYICDQPGKKQGKYIGCTGDNCTVERRDCDKSHDSTVCNDKCDEESCVDESECDGYKYGITCTIAWTQTINDFEYFPVHMICDGFVVCRDNLDEQNCTVTNSTVYTCTQYNSEDNIVVPILNHTRCSVFDLENIRDRVFPYCREYLDQTNCSDTQRIGGYCMINGYVSSVSKYVVCHNYDHHLEANVELCDDNLQNDCISTFTNCILHKHKMCDGNDDCYDNSDEVDDMCNTKSKIARFACVRKFNPNHGYISLPLSWVMDGTFDCMEGEDENSTLWRVCPGEFKKVLLPGDKCQDVYRCPAGDRLNVQFANLCDGVESCGNGAENDVCRIARDFPVIEKVSSFDGSLRDVCRVVKNGNSTSCEVKDFNKPWGGSYVLGVITRKQLILPTTKTKCSHLFGENYLFLSCMDLCLEGEITCPLDSYSNILPYDACPGQYPNRTYTMVNNSFLTFFEFDNGSYHQEIYRCNNSRCVEFKQVCDLTNDCGDMSDEMECKNHMICEDSLRSTKHQFISLSQKCDGIYDCFDLSDECNESCGKEILETWAVKIICWSLGILAMLLNLLSIFRGLATLKECETKTMMTSKSLMILIAFGDLHIGIYLAVLSVYDAIIFGEDFCKNQADWLTGPECMILGIVSTLGSQTSLFTMTILSIIRMRGLTQLSLHEPVNKISTLVTFIQGLIIYMSSLFIAAAPLVPALEDYFVQGMYYDHTYSVFIGFPNKDKHIKVLRAYYGQNITDKAVNISDKMSWKEIGDKVDGMFSQDFGTLTRSPVHFYGNDGVCLFKYFVRTDDARRSRQPLETMDFNGDPIVWAILALNFCCFIVITFCYIVITYKTKASSERSGQQDNLDRQRNERAIQSMITVIIATDFLCWVPFIIICALHNLAYVDASSWYAPFAMTVLPLNSVINPLVYDRKIVLSALGNLSKLKSYLERSVRRSLAVIVEYFNSDSAPEQEIQMNDLGITRKGASDGNGIDGGAENANESVESSGNEINNNTVNEAL